MQSESKNQLILVTGGAQRIGEQIVRWAASAGHRVVIHCRQSGPHAEAIRAQCGAGVVGIEQADLANPAEIERMIGSVIRAHGPVDALIHCAASFEHLDFRQTDAEAFDRIVATNLRSGHLLARELLSQSPRAPGNLIFFGDTHGRTAWTAGYAHAIAKSAVETMTRILAKELAPHTRVNCIVPGPILPPESDSEEKRVQTLIETPMKRWGGAQAIVEAVRYLIGADFVTGTSLVVDGGVLARHGH